MANNCDTVYRITGSRKAVQDLWVTLQSFNVESNDVWLSDLAEHYGIDYQKRHISVRGHIYFAELQPNDDTDSPVLTIETDTAWTGCHDLFRAIGEVLWDELSISYREIESGCGIFCIHDEGDFFPEECCVDSYGEPFEDAFGDIYSTTEDAIKVWCERTGNARGSLSTEEMVAYINDQSYEDEDTYCYINIFTRE